MKLDVTDTSSASSIRRFWRVVNCRGGKILWKWERFLVEILLFNYLLLDTDRNTLNVSFEK